VGQHYVGLLALFVALGGTSYAASKIDSNDIARNAIVSRHVARDALKSKDVKNIKGVDVRDGSLRGGDIARDSLGGDQVDEAALNATRVVARFHVTPNLTLTHRAGSADPPNRFAIPGGWTQYANETDEFVGEATFTFPEGCRPPHYAGVVIVRPDGSQVASGEGDPGFRETATATILGHGPGARSFEPGVDTPRTLSLEGYSQCGPDSTDYPVLNTVSLNVIGYR
jgi:hypothetical protein